MQNNNCGVGKNWCLGRGRFLVRNWWLVLGKIIGLNDIQGVVYTCPYLVLKLYIFLFYCTFWNKRRILIWRRFFSRIRWHRSPWDAACICKTSFYILNFYTFFFGTFLETIRFLTSRIYGVFIPQRLSFHNVWGPLQFDFRQNFLKNLRLFSGA